VADAAGGGARKPPRRMCLWIQDCSFRGTMSKRRSSHGVSEKMSWFDGESYALAAQPRKWGTIEGAVAGFRSGADDVTAVSILDKPNPMVLVGRASGYLQLLSIDTNDFGRSLAWFHPFPNDAHASAQQNEVQSLTTSASESTTAMVTKNSLFFYPLTRT
jgi:hypothetical protein